MARVSARTHHLSAQQAGAVAPSGRQNGRSKYWYVSCGLLYGPTLLYHSVIFSLSSNCSKRKRMSDACHSCDKRLLRRPGAHRVALLPCRGVQREHQHRKRRSCPRKQAHTGAARELLAPARRRRPPARPHQLFEVAQRREPAAQAAPRDRIENESLWRSRSITGRGKQ